ncbi:hypothetical protein [Klebsiella phage vB_KvaS_F1M1D]|nr:hypothetical protein [Klebsiella phage vB_KvaS_F1M1D]
MRIYSFFIKLVFDHDTRKFLALYHKKTPPKRGFNLRQPFQELKPIETEKYLL